LRVFVAGNPVGSNHMYGNRKTFDKAMHTRHLTESARLWREAIAVTVMPWRYAPEAQRPNLSVSCIFLGARADVDNLLKLTLDGLKDGLLVDDRFVLKVCAEKRPLSAGTEKGAWIEVSELPPAQPVQHAQPRPSRTRNKRTA
jgi:Holliday junction resolvase RusA-like endonuclease